MAEPPTEPVYDRETDYLGLSIKVYDVRDLAPESEYYRTWQGSYDWCTTGGGCQTPDATPPTCGLPIIRDVSMQNALNELMNWTKMPVPIPVNYLSEYPEGDGGINDNSDEGEQSPPGDQMPSMNNDVKQYFWTGGRRGDNLERHFQWAQNSGEAPHSMPFLTKPNTYFPPPIQQNMLNNWRANYPKFDGTLANNNAPQTDNYVLCTNDDADVANPSAFRPGSNLNKEGISWGGKWMNYDGSDNTLATHIVCFDGSPPLEPSTLPPVNNCSNDGVNGSDTCEQPEEDDELNMLAYSIVSIFLMCIVFGGTYYKFYHCFRSSRAGGNKGDDSDEEDSDEDSEWGGDDGGVMMTDGGVGGRDEQKRKRMLESRRMSIDGGGGGGGRNRNGSIDEYGSANNNVGGGGVDDEGVEGGAGDGGGEKKKVGRRVIKKIVKKPIAGSGGNEGAPPPGAEGI